MDCLSIVNLASVYFGVVSDILEHSAPFLSVMKDACRHVCVVVARGGINPSVGRGKTSRGKQICVLLMWELGSAKQWSCDSFL